MGINKSFLNEEEIFRVNYLVNSFGMSEESILEKLTDNHAENFAWLDKCDACASMMYDCHVNSHISYLSFLGKTPAQIQNRFRKCFEGWLSKQGETNIRRVICEVINVDDDFKSCEINWKYIHKMIGEHNNQIKEA
jgi:hypothetical protein